MYPAKGEVGMMSENMMGLGTGGGIDCLQSVTRSRSRQEKGFRDATEQEAADVDSLGCGNFFSLPVLYPTEHHGCRTACYRRQNSGLTNHDIEESPAWQGGCLCIIQALVESLRSKI